MEVQVFGVRNDAVTRKALRFFSERRVKAHFVDLKERPASKGELRRFLERHGADAMIDRSSKRLHSLGLQRAFYGNDKWLDILSEEPLLLRMPLVRLGKSTTVGLAEDSWQKWVDEEG